MTAPTADAGQAAAERKLFANLRAEAARSGVELYELGDGSYLLQRWNLRRELPDLPAVRDLMQRMGIAA